MPDKIHVLLAEDEPALGQIIKESLETRDFKVQLCPNGEVAYNTYRSTGPDILVLDVMMPKMDGFTLARKIREEDTETPVLFLTAKSQAKDVVEGFQVGGNDYLKKPFSMEELIVRMHNLLDRLNMQRGSKIYTIGSYTFDFPKQLLTFEQDPPEMLTHREAHLLYHLIDHRNNVLERTFILNKLWGADDFFAARSMDVFISKLRKKLARDTSLQIINVRGFGYKLLVP